jgi:site-specific recombinase XerC
MIILCAGPIIGERQKYSKLGLVTSEVLTECGVEPGIASILAGVANFGLSANTWRGYETIINHLKRCSTETGCNMELPFDTAKTLNLVGWMIDSRNLKGATISKYLSALRMYHLALGYNEPALREPIVKLILKGKSNWDLVEKKISGEKGRLPVTANVLKLMKKKLVKASWPVKDKRIFWAVATILWNGSFRVHEILSRDMKEYVPLSTLLWEDIEMKTVKIEEKVIEAIAFKIKSPKVDRLGDGDYLEVYETGLYNCPIAAFKKYRDISDISEHPNRPVFRVAEDKCMSGRQFNKQLSQLTGSLEQLIPGGRITSHSFRAGVASEMCRAGYSEEDIKAVGRWESGAYKAYLKLPRTHRAVLARTISKN